MNRCENVLPLSKLLTTVRQRAADSDALEVKRLLFKQAGTLQSALERLQDGGCPLPAQANAELEKPKVNPALVQEYLGKGDAFFLELPQEVKGLSGAARITAMLSYNEAKKQHAKMVEQAKFSPKPGLADELPGQCAGYGGKKRTLQELWGSIRGKPAEEASAIAAQARGLQEELFHLDAEHACYKAFGLPRTTKPKADKPPTQKVAQKPKSAVPDEERNAFWDDDDDDDSEPAPPARLGSPQVGATPKAMPYVAPATPTISRVIAPGKGLGIPRGAPRYVVQNEPFVPLDPAKDPENGFQRWSAYAGSCERVYQDASGKMIRPLDALYQLRYEDRVPARTALNCVHRLSGHHGAQRYVTTDYAFT